ncbi:uncharacterized protein LOC141905715 [Tubulanus polymorphus]|uniref:uncharacterized protein LOC141905715 n=1 Tax=Tubulanus polymorphus TaxID=672921 RepID=UPI003DA4E7E3
MKVVSASLIGMALCLASSTGHVHHGRKMKPIIHKFANDRIETVVDTGVFDQMEKHFMGNDDQRETAEPPKPNCHRNKQQQFPREHTEERWSTQPPCTVCSQHTASDLNEAVVKNRPHKNNNLNKKDQERLANTKERIRSLNKQMNHLDEQQKAGEKIIRDMKLRRQQIRAEEIKRQEELEVISQEARKMKENRDRMRLEKAAQIRRQQELEAARLRYERERARILQQAGQHEDENLGQTRDEQMPSEDFGDSGRESGYTVAEGLKQALELGQAIKSMERSLTEVAAADQDNPETGESNAEKSSPTSEGIPAVRLSESTVDSNSKHVQLGAFKVYNFYPDDISIKTIGHFIHISGRYEICKCNKNNCEKSEFQHHFSISQSIDTSSIHATLDADRILRIHAVDYEGTVIEPEDRQIRILGLGIEKSRPATSTSCSDGQRPVDSPTPPQPPPADYPKVGKVYNKPRTFVITAEPEKHLRILDEL